MNRKGDDAERYFEGMMDSLGLSWTRIDDWFDYLVEGEKVEVKSCGLAVRNGKDVIQGRYNFTKKYNRKLQYMENIWVCFIVRHEEQFICQGFCRAKELDMKKYVSITQAWRLRPKNVETFKEYVAKSKHLNSSPPTPIDKTQRKRLKRRGVKQNE